MLEPKFFLTTYLRIEEQKWETFVELDKQVVQSMWFEKVIANQLCYQLILAVISVIECMKVLAFSPLS